MMRWLAFTFAALLSCALSAEEAEAETVPLPVVKSSDDKPPPKPAPDKPTPPKSDGDTPAAEFVPLPAEKPDQPVVAKAATIAKTVVDEKTTLLLTMDKAVLQPGEQASFGLYGPEEFLRNCAGHYQVKDQLDRVVAQGLVRIQDLPFKEGEPRRLQVPAFTPLAQQHSFQLQLTTPDARTFALTVPFHFARTVRWNGWLALTSAPPVSGNWAALNELGVRGGLQYRLHPARREALRKGLAPFFVENVSRQLLSRYHTEPGLWEKSIAAMLVDRNARGPLAREPSLCSPQFAEQLALELKAHAEIYRKDPPLFYSLASEPSVTRLAAAADFDFSPAALVEFQRWLERDVYGTLKALNASWGTDFAAWTDVQPMTTDEVQLRLRDGVYNFAPWVDFREFQDHVFAKILHDSGGVIRQYHPDAKIGITGALGPAAFGGWDWWRLANALDVIEAYDIGCARRLWRDLAPGKPALATFAVPAQGEPAQTAAELAQTLWPFALDGGSRGVLLWDETNGKAFLDETQQATGAANAIAPLLKTLEQKIGPLLAHCRRKDDGIAVLYSPASIRVTWLLEANHLHGENWLKQWGGETSAERRDSLQLRLRESWAKLLDDLGLGWRFIASAQIESRALAGPDRPHTLILPRAIALSEREIDAIKQFVQDGGRIVADAACGHFDEHGRRRARGPFDEMFGLDTAGEPLLPARANPLELLQPVALPKGIDPAVLREFAPTYSDVPKATANHISRIEYRRSPVLAASKAGVYLNLDLTDYLRWRLHPDRPRAKNTRDLLTTVAFSKAADDSPIDWTKTQLPQGTQVVRLSIGGGGAEVLALRRNPQTRLHELGTEAEGNWAFEQAERFVLTLRQARGIQQFFPESGTQTNKPLTKLEGTLQPNDPVIFIVAPAETRPLQISLPAEVRAGGSAELTAKGEAGSGQLFAVSVIGPDGKARTHYGGTVQSEDGTLTHRVPFAFNDPLGAWKIIVQHLNSGARQEATVQVKVAE